MAKRRANGEGSICKRKDGRYTARITTEAGRRKEVYGNTRSEAAWKLTKLLKAKQDGLPIPSELVTMEAFMQSWLDGYHAQVRPATWDRYESLVRCHLIPCLGRVRLARLKPAHLQKLYTDRLDVMSATSVRQLHSVVHRALEDAVRWGDVARNVASLVKPPRIARHEITPWNRAEASRFLEEVRGDRFEALFVLALTTGMRRGELLALRWRDVDLDLGFLQVRHSLQILKGKGPQLVEPKTRRSRRRIKLAAIAIQALMHHRTRQAEERLSLGPAWDDLDFVFPNKLGRPKGGPNLFRDSFKPAMERANVPTIRFHDLRHTAATLLLSRGVHPKVVSEMLGHGSIGLTLDTYSHVLPDMQASAAAAMDLAFG